MAGNLKRAFFFLFIFCALLTCTCLAHADAKSDSDGTTAVTAKSFLQKFPNLKQYVFKPPKSGFYLGMGLSPIGFASNRYIFAADFFQVHYLTANWDIELLNASYAVTRAQSSEFESDDFTFRSAAKYRITDTLSAGPLLGFEFVSFPKVGSHIVSPTTDLETKDQPFSSHGLIYGAMVSETYPYKKNYYIQINEMAYQETYSTTKTAQNWIYLYDDPSITGNHNLIGAQLVYMLGFSFLY